MSAGLKSVVVKFVGDVTSLTEASRKAGADLGGFAAAAKHHGDLISKAFNFAVLGVAAGMVVRGVEKVGGALSGLVKDAEAAQSAARITANVIRSTGGAANVSVEQVDKLTTSISNLTGTDEDVVRSGANMLLTFTNVRNAAGKNNDIFNQANTAAVDMAAAMNQGHVTTDGLKSASIQLGKALSDPAKGLTALKRVGVTFTDQQKQQIDAMVKSGNTMGAQKIILAELNKEFGGTAAAATDPMQKAAVAWENFKKQVGGYVLPVVEKFFDFLSKNVLPALSQFADYADKKIVPALKRLGQWIQQNVVPQLEKLWQWMARNIPPALRLVWDWIQNKLIPAFEAIWQFFVSQFLPVLEAFYRKIAASLIPALQALWKQLQTNVFPALLTLWKIFKDDLWPILKVVIAVLGTLAAFIIGTVVPVLLNILGPALRDLALGLAVVVEGVKLVGKWLGKIGGWAQDAWNGIKSAFGAVGGFFSGIGSAIGSGIHAGLNEARNLVNDFIHGINQVDGISILGHRVGIPSIPDIPPFANGGIMKSTGMALVGERGPELVRLPGGSQVIPNNKIGGGDIHLTLDLGEGIRQRIRIAQNQRDRGTRGAVIAGASRAFV